MIAHLGGEFQKLFPIPTQKKTPASNWSLNFISSIDLIQSLYPHPPDCIPQCTSYQ